MAYLKNIVKQIEQEFKVHIHGFTNTEQQIESVQFLLSTHNDNFNPMPSTLYIGNYPDHCNHIIEGPVLLLNCRTSHINETGLYIYQQLNLFEVSNCIQQELLRSHETKLKKEEMFHVLHSGCGIQSLINTARSFFQNPITICSTSFSIIACSPIDDMNQSLEWHNNKKYIKKSSLQHMEKKKVMEHLFKSSTPLITRFDNDTNTDFLFCSIHIKRAAVGYICIRSDVRAFTEDDISFVMDLSHMLSIEMQKEEFFIQKSGVKYEYFLTDLIERNLDNIEFATKRLIQLGQEFYNYFWTITFSFSGDSTNHLKPNYYIDQLLHIFRHSMVFFYKGTLVLLLTSKNTEPFADINVQKLNSFLQLNQMYAAISYRYENLLDTYMYYEQSMYLLNSKKITHKDRIYSYSDNYLFHVLGQNQLPIKSFIHPDIIYLMNYDKKNNTDYINTIKCYLEHNRNALSAAKHLHIHKSTFFYRIGKIAELIDMNIDNCRFLFAYEFSFAILDYMNSQS